jgi:hypothetical protein
VHNRKAPREATKISARRLKILRIECLCWVHRAFGVENRPIIAHICIDLPCGFQHVADLAQIGDEINMISGGFKHFGSRYAHYSIDMAAKARAGAVSQSSKTTNDAISPTRSGSDDASEHEKSGDGPNIGRTSSQESVLSRTLSSDSDSASSVKSGKPARRKFVRSSERGGGKARKAESARRQKSRRAVVMMDRFEV